MSISDIGPILLTCMLACINVGGPGNKQPDDVIVSWFLMFLTSKVRSEAVIIILEKTVQQLGNIVGCLLDQAGG